MKIKLLNYKNIKNFTIKKSKQNLLTKNMIIIEL